MDQGLSKPVKRALLIGADNLEPVSLFNMINVEVMKDLVVKKYKFSEGNVTTLVKLDSNSTLKSVSKDSTKENIEQAIQTLAQLCKSGDVVLLYLTGHAGRTDTSVSFRGSDDKPVSGTFIQRFVGEISTKCRMYMLADTCFAELFFNNNLLKSKRKDGGQTSTAPSLMTSFDEGVTNGPSGLFFLGASRAKMTAVFCSNPPPDPSLEDSDDDKEVDNTTCYGVFTRTLLRVIKNSKGRVENGWLAAEMPSRAHKVSYRHACCFYDEDLATVEFLD